MKRLSTEVSGGINNEAEDRVLIDMINALTVSSHITIEPWYCHNCVAVMLSGFPSIVDWVAFLVIQLFLCDRPSISRYIV